MMSDESKLNGINLLMITTELAPPSVLQPVHQLSQPDQSQVNTSQTTTTSLSNSNKSTTGEKYSRKRRATSQGRPPSTNEAHDNSLDSPRTSDSSNSNPKKHQNGKVLEPCTYLMNADHSLRYVRPYPFEFSCFVKKRWWQQSILEMLKKEYKNPTPNYYDSLLNASRITVTPTGRQKKSIIDPTQLRAHRLQSNDLITIQMHRHEPPVSGRKIQIIHYQPNQTDTLSTTSTTTSSIDLPNATPTAVTSILSSSSTDISAPSDSNLPLSDLIVVNKPGGIPVHASGRYYWNTIVGILKNEHNIEAFSVHRLDRVTSGLLLLSLTRSACVSIGRQFEERLVRKEYVARVRGEFPSGIQIVQGAIQLRGRRGGAEGGDEAEEDQQQRKKQKVENPTSSVDLSTCDSTTTSTFSDTVIPANPYMSSQVPARVQPTTTATTGANPLLNPDSSTSNTAAPPLADPSKTASTEFERLSFDGHTSLVRCRPLTGRTHQIRAHLSSLGYPIANDFLYGGHLYASNTYQDESHRLMASHGVPWVSGCQECEEGKKELEIAATASVATTTTTTTTTLNSYTTSPSSTEINLTPVQADAPAPSTSSNSIPTTPTSFGTSSPPSSTSSSPHIYCSSIWLHCYSYTGPHWSFQAPMPKWAEPNFDSTNDLAHPIHLTSSATELQADEE